MEKLCLDFALQPRKADMSNWNGPARSSSMMPGQDQMDPNMPSEEAFEAQVEEYISSLNAKKREKALVSRLS